MLFRGVGARPAVLVTRIVIDSYERVAGCCFYSDFARGFEMCQAGADVLHGQCRLGGQRGQRRDHRAARNDDAFPAAFAVIDSQQQVQEQAHGIGVVVPFPFGEAAEQLEPSASGDAGVGARVLQRVPSPVLRCQDLLGQYLRCALCELCVFEWIKLVIDKSRSYTPATIFVYCKDSNYF